MGDAAVAVLFLGRFLQGDRVQPLSLSDDLERRMTRDAQHPCREAGLATKPLQVLHRAQEGLLRHVLRVLLLPQHPQRQRINPLFVTVGQRLKCGQLSPLGAFHQLRVRWHSMYRFLRHLFNGFTALAMGSTDPRAAARMSVRTVATGYGHPQTRSSPSDGAAWNPRPLRRWGRSKSAA